MVHSLEDMFTEAQVQAEMLRLLKDIHYYHTSDLRRDPTNWIKLFERLESVIAKAEGKQ